MTNPYQPEKNSPGRAVIPVTALAAVVITVILFNCFYEKMGAEKAICAAAVAAFVLTALIGFCFKPILGE